MRHKQRGHADYSAFVWGLLLLVVLGVAAVAGVVGLIWWWVTR